MEELFFHMSNQLEALQVQFSVTAQQGQQWISVWLAKIEQFFQNLYYDRNFLQLRQHVQAFLQLMQRSWDQVLYQYYSTNMSIRSFYHQIGQLCLSEVSRREVAFCLGGIIFGSILGYYFGVNWKNTVRYVHHMKAIICHQYIGIEGVLMIDDAEMPVITKSNEVMIQVKAASVNLIDTKICHGYSRIYKKLLNSRKHKNLPVVLGRDCAGIVVSIGHSVMNFDIGDEVFLAVPSWAPGTMAEYIVVPETQVAKRPKFFSFEESATLPYNGCLALDAVMNRSIIQEGNAEGKRVLICGGNTPIGCILIQLIKLWGGYVVAICRKKALPVLRALGAEEVILSDDSDIGKQLELQDQFDAIFYTGGQPIDENIVRRYLRPHGSYVSTVPEQLTSDSLGFICSSIFAGYVGIKLLIQYMFGFNMYQWKEGSKIKTSYLQAICDLSDAYQLQVVIDRTYGLHNIEQALYHVLDPDTIGSTVITFQRH